MLKIPYPRPKKLTNLGCCYSDKELNLILSKKDHELIWHDFRDLFIVSNCVGEYEEIVYFLPFYFFYLLNTPEDSLDCINEIPHFIKYYKENLIKDGIFNDCLELLYALPDRWTSEFNIVHYDKKACESKGWVLKHNDIVGNSQLVCEFIDNLCSKNLEEIAIKFIRNISADNASDIKSAWFLEYANETIKDYEYYSEENKENRKKMHDKCTKDYLSSEMYKQYNQLLSNMLKDLPSDEAEKVEKIFSETENDIMSFGYMEAIDMIPTKKIPEIYEILMDQDKINFHYNKILNTIIKNEKSPTYWDDLKNYLKI